MPKIPFHARLKTLIVRSHPLLRAFDHRAQLAAESAERAQDQMREYVGEIRSALAGLDLAIAEIVASADSREVRLAETERQLQLLAERLAQTSRESLPLDDQSSS